MGDFNWKMQGEDHETRKCTKGEKSNTLTVDQAVRRGCHFKYPSRASFFHPFPLVLHVFFPFNCQKGIFEAFAADWGLQIDFWSLGLWIWDPGLWIWDGFFFFDAHHSRFQLFSRVPRVSGVCFSRSTSLVSFIFAFLMAPRRETTVSRA